MKIQWHPVFARLLRPLVERHYEVQTNVPVGDAPRQADIVLLRRTSTGRLPFHGLWRDLTAWNVLEFKGPTVSARVGDIDLLVELGLGIHRRLNEEQEKQQQSPLGAEEVSFWYLANSLGRRFLRDARDLLGNVAPHGPGVWRCVLLRRLIFLVSGTELPVNEDSLPLHIVSREPAETGRQVAKLLAQRPALWREYSGWLATLHPDLWEEVRSMGKTARKGFGFHLKPVIEEVGLKQVIEEVGVERVIEEVGLERIIKQLSVDELLAQLTPAQRRELKQRLQ
jgi:hypothetical protein